MAQDPSLMKKVKGIKGGKSAADWNREGGEHQASYSELCNSLSVVHRVG